MADAVDGAEDGVAVLDESVDALDAHLLAAVVVDEGFGRELDGRSLDLREPDGDLRDRHRIHRVDAELLEIIEFVDHALQVAADEDFADSFDRLAEILEVYL